jgi:DNA modification methylase
MAARPRTRRPTATSNFGVSRRESHDASGFYARFATPDFSDDDTINPPISVDEIHLGDARHMSQVADASVALVVTSPPYFAGKAYEEELGSGHIPASYVEYLEMLTDVFADCVRALEPGGRIAVNVANLGRRPYRSLAADVTAILQDRLALWLRGEVIWLKGRGANGNCAWGSFRLPSNPVLRDVTERVVIASKGRLSRTRNRRPTITRDEFLEATLDVWELPTERASRVGHPAPFPVELPQRLIELYTYEGDLVLDPFMGSGSTAVAAARTGRHFVGYDTDPDYVELARKRVIDEADCSSRPPAPSDGAGLVEATRVALCRAGFADLRGPVRRGAGLEYAFSVTDRRGASLLVDVVGGYTTTANGLRRTELLWRTLGRAATVRAQDPDQRILVVTSELPVPPHPGATALRHNIGSVITDALELGAPGTAARLAQLAAGD